MYVLGNGVDLTPGPYRCLFHDSLEINKRRGSFLQSFVRSSQK